MNEDQQPAPDGEPCDVTPLEAADGDPPAKDAGQRPGIASPPGREKGGGADDGKPEKDGAGKADAKSDAKGGLVDAFKKTVLPCLVGYGLFVLFIYFYGVIGFFPSGLTLGDSVLLLFIAFGYGFLSLICLLAGFVLVAPVIAALESYRVVKALARESREKVAAKVAGTSAGLPEATSGAEPEPAGTLGGLWLPLTALMGVVAALGVAWLAQPSAGEPAALRLEFLSRFAWWLVGVAIVIANFGVALLPMWASRRVGEVWQRMDASFLALVPAYCGAVLGGGIAIAKWGASIATSMLMAAAAGTLVAMVITVFSAQTKADTVPSDADAQATRQRQRLVTFVLLAAAWLCPLVWDIAIGKFFLTQRVVSSLSLRTEGATVRASGKSVALLAEVVGQSNAIVHMCRDKDGSVAFSPIDVLWHGVGKRSWLGLPGEKTNFEVDADDIKIVRSPQQSCHDLASVEYFASGKSLPVPELDGPFLRELRELAAQRQDGWRLQRLEFTGDVDPMSLPEGGNDSLACDRAVQAMDAASAIFKGRTVSMDALSAGSRSPAKEGCATAIKARDQQECQALNRRVTARAFFVVASTVTTAAASASEASREAVRCRDVRAAASDALKSR